VKRTERGEANRDPGRGHPKKRGGLYGSALYPTLEKRGVDGAEEKESDEPGEARERDTWARKKNLAYSKDSRRQSLEKNPPQAFEGGNNEWVKKKGKVARAEVISQQDLNKKKKKREIKSNRTPTYGEKSFFRKRGTVVISKGEGNVPKRKRRTPDCPKEEIEGRKRWPAPSKSARGAERSGESRKRGEKKGASPLRRKKNRRPRRKTVDVRKKTTFDKRNRGEACPKDWLQCRQKKKKRSVFQGGRGGRAHKARDRTTSGKKRDA